MKQTICYISCIGKVQNERVVRFLRILALNNYHVTSISPGLLTNPQDMKAIHHYPLPEVNNFVYNGGIINILHAIEQRLRNAFLLCLRLFHERPKFLICAEPDSWLIAVLAKFFIGCKVVADLQEVYDDRAVAFPKLLQNIVRKLLRLLMRGLSCFTDEVIHVSLERSQVYNYLHKVGIVIGSYPDLSFFPLRTNSKASGPMTIIHAGALRPTYASEQLLEAMNIISDLSGEVKLVVLGGIVGKLKNAYLIDFLSDKGVLELHGIVPYSEVIKKLYEGDVGINLVLPVDVTHRFAAPQKLYEYLAAGLPVIGANVPTIQHVIKKYECGIIVDASSPHEIAKAMILLQSDSAMRIRMGHRARVAADVEFNWQIECSKLLRVFQILNSQDEI